MIKAALGRDWWSLIRDNLRCKAATVLRRGGLCGRSRKIRFSIRDFGRALWFWQPCLNHHGADSLLVGFQCWIEGTLERIRKR